MLNFLQSGFVSQQLDSSVSRAVLIAERSLLTVRHDDCQEFLARQLSSLLLAPPGAASVFFLVTSEATKDLPFKTTARARLNRACFTTCVSEFNTHARSCSNLTLDSCEQIRIDGRKHAEHGILQVFQD